MRGLLLGVVFCVLGGSHAAAADKENNFHVMGYGFTSCATWASNNKPGEAPLVHFLELQWVLGYVSAYNEYVSPSGRVGGEIDNEALIVWIDNYCADKPLDSEIDATHALIKELRNKGP